MDMETKIIGGHVSETKRQERNGQPIGIVKGYITTWDIDGGYLPDMFVKGCFRDSIKDHKARNRQVRLKDSHRRLVGGFPIETVKEDNKGLYGEGEINLNTQIGQELFALVQQKVLTDFSVGFSALDREFITIKDEDIRKINKAIIWEGSLVDEPMNQEAMITEFKSAVSYQDLPLADRKLPWSAATAKKRVRTWAGADDGLDTATKRNKYRRAFLWYDKGDAENFGAYKLPIADVINGTLTAIPRGVFAAAGVLRGARGGVDVPEADKAKIIRHIERYYSKMGLESPFKEKSLRIDDFSVFEEKDLEYLLKSGCFFTGQTSKALISAIKAAGLRDEVPGGARDGLKGWENMVAELNAINQKLKGEIHA